MFLMPPQIIHNDTVVYHDVNTHNHHSQMDHLHEDYHHKNDSNKDKQTKHHHHCNIQIVTLTAFVHTAVEYSLDYFIPKEISKIQYYKSLHTTDFIKSLFRPPIS